MAIFEDGVYAVKNGDMYKITLPEPVFKGAKTIKLQLRPETNADRIRSMTDEELAKFISCPEHNDWRTICFKDDDCLMCKTKWLKEEAVDNGACSANETSEKAQDGE